MAARRRSRNPAKPAAAKAATDSDDRPLLHRAAFGLLLVVLAARPLIHESYSSAEIGLSAALPVTFWMSSPLGDASPNATFARALLPIPSPAVAIDVSVPRGTTVTGLAATPPGIPGRDHWETGAWTVTVPVMRPAADVSLEVVIERVDAAGQTTERYTSDAKPLTAAGEFAFGFDTPAWRPGNESDRLAVRYVFKNASAQDHDVSIATNGRVSMPAPHHAAWPGSLITVVFDAMILFAGLLYALGRLGARPTHYRRTGAEVGIALLLVALCISTSNADNTRLAMVGAVDFGCLLLMFVLFAQLLRRPWQARLTLCVIVATATVSAARCFDQVFVEFDETIRLYSEAERDSWSEQGRSLDDPMVRLFRSRLMARDPTGYMAHPNIAASHLMLAAFAALTLAAAKWFAAPVRFRRMFAILTFGLVVLIGVAVTLTHSRGAMLAGVVAAAMFFGLSRIDWSNTAHRRRTVIVAWIGMALGGALVVSWGVRTGSLPGSSLTFRWQYWSTAAHIVGDHVGGTGTAHFGRHYLRHKAVTSPDEVANAHNLFVQAASEWGWLGLIGLIVLLVGVSLRLTGVTSTDAETTTQRTGRPLVWMVGLTATTVTSFVVAQLGADPLYLIATAMLPALIFPVAFVLGALDSDRSDQFNDQPLSVATRMLGAGLFAFLLHNVISFSLFVPAAATPFVALAATAVAVRHRPAEVVSPSIRILLLRGLSVAVVFIFALIGWTHIRPVATAGWHLFRARSAAAYDHPSPDADQHVANRHFAAAMRADSRDPVPPADWARWLADSTYTDEATTRQGHDLAAEKMRAALQRDLSSVSLLRQLAATRFRAFELLGDLDALREAITAARRVVTLYPQSPQDYLTLARLCDSMYTETAESDWGEQTLTAYRRALDLDGARPDYELRRFAPADRDSARQRVNELTAAGHEPRG